MQMAAEAAARSPGGIILLESALTPSEQRELFDFVRGRDATKWASLPRCMVPTPKTLDLYVQSERDRADGKGCETARTILIDPAAADGEVDDRSRVAALVEKVRSIIVNQHTAIESPSLLSSSISSIKLAVIRYCIEDTNPSVGHVLPPHVDHCNDGSWVFLFSLGCSASFFVQLKEEGGVIRHDLELESGDVLVFDPSSEAGILHGVNGILRKGDGDGDGDVGMIWDGTVLRDGRYGVQCRVSFS